MAGALLLTVVLSAMVVTGVASSSVSAQPALPYTRPVKGVISSPYGLRADPVHHHWRHHDGIDIVAPYGHPIGAFAPGRVVYVGWISGYGRLVAVSHRLDNQILISRYAHLQDWQVQRGDTVRAGTVIGHVGLSGRTTGPHLHFELRRDGQAVDPTPYLAQSVLTATGKPASSSTPVASAVANLAKKSAATLVDRDSVGLATTAYLPRIRYIVNPDMPVGPYEANSGGKYGSLFLLGGSGLLGTVLFLMLVLAWVNHRRAVAARMSLPLPVAPMVCFGPDGVRPVRGLTFGPVSGRPRRLAKPALPRFQNAVVTLTGQNPFVMPAHSGS
ncbi:MAG: M23 family metallopeptidase [Cyanobacteria bacterium HKST-UBA04]|nr:M23 family metallopeptidase [Cyanobacteria bacterium HKST-UBA04]